MLVTVSPVARGRKEKPVQFRLQTVSDPKFVRSVRDFVSKVAEAHGFSREGAFDVRLVVGEALANIIRHAYKEQKNRPIFLELSLFSTFLEIQIRDFGIQKPVSEIVARDLSEYRESGLGIYLISKLTDYHFFDQSVDQGTLLTMKKRIC